MAQNSQAPKSKWGVGNFFQQAVAGVESRLDNILMDQEEAQKASNTKPKEAETTASPISRSPAGSISRSSSNARRNDRLQERLARAVVKSNTANRNSQSSPGQVSSTAGSPAPSNGAQSRMDTDASLASTATVRDDLKSPPPDGEIVTSHESAARRSYDSEKSMRESIEVSGPESLPRVSNEVDEQGSKSGRPSLDLLSSQRSDVSGGRVSGESTRLSVDTPSESQTSEDNGAESQWLQGRYEYMARIDELQRNLESLAEEAAKSAKDAAAAASPGSREKELAETREKYALLMKEGQKLESEASNSRTAVRRLRQQLAENSKLQIEMKKKTERLERDLLNAESRAKRAEAAEKRANDSLSTHTKMAKDLEAVTNERDALTQTVREMKAQVSRAIARAEASEAKAHSDALEKEKRRADELDEELSNTKIELDILQAKSKKDIADWKEKVDQEKERARLLEMELRGELSALESKMESLRARAEEASSGATGETQAKLLRQVETLQTQNLVASENWHTLEGSYISRLGAAEKERDQAGEREKELRKKLREMSLKVKELEEELESAKEAEHDLESQLEARVQELQKVQQKLENATAEVTSAQKELVEQKKVWDANWAQKLEEERARWREQVFALQQPRGISPVPSTRRSSNLDALPSVLSDYRPSSRRSSTLPPVSPDIGTPPRQNSYPTSIAPGTLSPPPISTTMGMGPPSMILETPSISFEPDEFFSSGDPGTPSGYGGTQAGHSRGINDIISESTVGAGPSVQLVERMSATVRRLESERAGSKDELARVTAQRDESRQQVVDLMRELEEKKAADSRVEELEAKLADIDQRYLTTLEMLGEKSEQVEELQADIADLKKIYRELVDSTMK
ncbi:Protein sgm1 [Penicillium rolfsii]|nr:Protein sgm1 [Penicillium rolfsii]